MAALNLSVAGELSRLQRDGLNYSGRSVLRGFLPLLILSFFPDTVIIRGCP
ncbi:hypothetical protein BvCms2454_05113 [Escherichia coli]|nr:hypothetical protein BvCms2454_05113 [Escherichia coli]GDQ48960.1 hypothetical protein BvCmsNSP072_03640 [Escherichia coli]GDR97062.1 hypothetical protein BvCmsOUP027_04088 [Escherichia coli]GDS91047.1 hypothetical protein BvCmsOUP068_04738 [Escherichia coli]GDW00187.1 hypothetical protein BvCmsSINP059_00101 [Escherichia coli]